MPVTVIVGAQWGDEGKGKIIDCLAEQAKMVIRYSGGTNAGHTVINKFGEFKMHLVPSGIFHPDTVCVIGNGVVVDPGVLIKEINELKGRAIKVDNLVISDRAHLVMPYHVALDGLEEESRGGSALGTTLRGIGPAYADKTSRLGIRIGDLLDKNLFYRRLQTILKQKNAIITQVYKGNSLSLIEIYETYVKYAETLAPFIKQTDSLMQEALDKKEAVLMEGAQGALLDLDFGTYPYVTSSSPLAAGACIGMGISPRKIDSVWGVYKAYCTRVGGGPMPTELMDKTGDAIRKQAHEYGTTTGRPRRCGWFDAVAGKFSAQLNGFDGAVLTRLDVLDILPSVKICTGYVLDGKRVDGFPSNSELLQKCEPVYQEMRGWQQPIDRVRNYGDLPEAARQYVERLSELIGCRFKMISVGASREQTINVC